MRKMVFVLLTAVLFVITSSVFAEATEIWYSSKDVGQMIYRMTPDGTMLSGIGTGETNVKDLTVIGDEVWFSGNGAWIGRLDFDGTRLPGNFSSHEEIGDFTLVGDEIWISDADTSGWIERWTLDHVELSRIGTSEDISNLCVVGNEIWYCDKDVGQWIYRMTSDGTMLPSIGTGETNVKDLTVIGDEVWFSGNGAWIGRLDFDGTRLPGNFSSHEEIGDFALVGDEIWISDADTSGWIERWTLGHVELPRFHSGINDLGSFVVVPEPATLLLLGMGVISLRLKQKY